MSEYLIHHGVKGMKWGVRRYQNPDGSLTTAGKKKYNKSSYKNISKTYKRTRDSSRPLYIDENTNNAIRDELKRSGILERKEIKEDIRSLNSLKENWINLASKTEDFYDSKECEEATKKAYDLTYNYFKKNQPDFLKEIVSMNNGKTSNLTDFHGFRKAFEGYQDQEWQKAEKEWSRTDKAQASKLEERAYSAYNSKSKEIGNKVSKELLGDYGNEKLSMFDDFTYNDLVSGKVETIINENNRKK